MAKLRTTTAVKLTALLVLLAWMPAAAVKYVAVVETDVDAQSGASAELNPAEVRQITAELRRVAVKNLPRDKYNIMTSETVQSMGGAVLEECADENCVITLGSRIGADYIVRGTISKFGAKLTLAVEMYETENGTLVASSEPVRSERSAELLEMLVGACGEMYREFLGGQTQAAAGQQNNAQGTTQSTNNYTPKPNSRYNYSSYNLYNDFSGGQRFGTWALNYLIPGLGSFTVMKDNVGGFTQLGLAAAGYTMFAIGVGMGGDLGEAGSVVGISGIVIIFGNGIFNIIRSATYHKPQPKTAANNFKPYDGLKLAILPTESGDFKVVARYDYGF